MRINALADERLAYFYERDVLGNVVRERAFDALGPPVPAETRNRSYRHEGNRLSSGEETAFAYDRRAISCATKRGGRPVLFEYDVFGRLSSVHQNEDEFRFAYDPAGSRVRTQTEEGETRWLWDRSGLLSALLAEMNPAGEVERYFVYGLGLSHMITADGHSYFFQYDGLGSTTSVSESLARQSLKRLPFAARIASSVVWTSPASKRSSAALRAAGA